VEGSFSSVTSGEGIHAPTYDLALGIALLVAAARRAWRFPILALATLEYSFHTINTGSTSTTQPRVGRPGRRSAWRRVAEIAERTA
jgi:hypothetical protein